MEYFYPDIFLTFEQFDFIHYKHADGDFFKLANAGLSFILPDIINQMWFLLIISLFYYFNLVGLRLFVFLLARLMVAIYYESSYELHGWRQGVFPSFGIF